MEKPMTFTGEKQISRYQILVVVHALDFYSKHGIRINSAYSPKNMRAFAEAKTGKKFKPRDYQTMADELRKLI